MARRKESVLDDIASMPWPFGFVLGIVAYFFARHFGGPFALLGLIFLIACWAAATISFFRGLKRKRLLETQTSLDSLQSMSWREFETLVGEAFRRLGYSVEETGGGGKDGGIDLILRIAGRTELVQCKQWKTRQVKVSVVREMWGLLQHHDADAVKIVCVGTFTADAEQFAQGKAIELINGEHLLDLVRSVQSPARIVSTEPSRTAESPTTTSPTCPRCAAPMLMRSNRKTGQSFWGCSKYPECRGTNPA